MSRGMMPDTSRQLKDAAKKRWGVLTEFDSTPQEEAHVAKRVYKE